MEKDGNSQSVFDDDAPEPLDPALADEEMAPQLPEAEAVGDSQDSDEGDGEDEDR